LDLFLVERIFLKTGDIAASSSSSFCLGGIGWAAYSGQSCHPFQTNAATHSILKLPLIPVNVATLWW